MSRRTRHSRRPQSSTPAERGDAGLPDVAAVAPPAAVTAPAAPLHAEPPVAAAAPCDDPGLPVVLGRGEPAALADESAARTTCTQAQLRRFIKSRPWIPMHELRRRFGILGTDDDVTPIRVGDGTIFVGLPSAEGRMLGELLNGGDVGFELSLDPGAPIVVGVYPMRPVPRG